MNDIDSIFLGAVVCLGASASALASGIRGVLASEHIDVARGRRGEVRREARKEIWFRCAEIPIVVSSLVVRAIFEAKPFRAKSTKIVTFFQRKLLIAGLPLGLSVHEFFGAMSLTTVACGALGRCLFEDSGHGGFGCLLGGALACLFPVLRLDALYAERARGAMREIPRAMDLAGLCMSAGMDFTGALRTVVATDSGVVARELRELLRALEFGITRKAALYGLMERLPCVEVRDFCRAVIQADEKGASLAAALTQQARLCRMRRSLRAEENAARAAVMLIGPMMLLLLAILLVLMGPLFVGGVGI